MKIHKTKMTADQTIALYRIWKRPLSNMAANPLPWQQFSATAWYDYVSDCVMVPWAGMWLGIETDGYTINYGNMLP